MALTKLERRTRIKMKDPEKDKRYFRNTEACSISQQQADIVQVVDDLKKVTLLSASSTETELQTKQE